jgi:sporulation-control protein spo0M
MTTHFIELEIPLEQPLTVGQIEAELEKQGEPLRWAITQIDRQENKAIVEAVVTNSLCE